MARALMILFVCCCCFPVHAQVNCVGDDPNGFFIRGDANNDGNVNGSDVSYMFNYLYQVFGDDPPPCEWNAADVNDDGIQLNISDPVYLNNFLNLGGPQPPVPYVQAGYDCTPGESSCRLEPRSGGNRIIQDITHSGTIFTNCEGPHWSNQWDNKNAFAGQFPDEAVIIVSNDSQYEHPSACDLVFPSFEVTDNYYTTYQSLKSGAMAIYMKFQVKDIEWGPRPSPTEETICETECELIEVDWDTALVKFTFVPVGGGVTWQFSELLDGAGDLRARWTTYSGGASCPVIVCEHPQGFMVDGCTQDYSVTGPVSEELPSSIDRCDPLRLSSVTFEVPIKYYDDAGDPVKSPTEYMKFTLRVHDLQYVFTNCINHGGDFCN